MTTTNTGLRVISAQYHLTSIGRYSQSRKLPDREQGESHASHDAKAWKSRCHVNEQGFVVIPPMSFVLAVKSAIRLLGIKIPGKRNQTYSKLFDTSVMLFEGVTTTTHIDHVKGEVIFVPSDGKSGGGTRVDKKFPFIEQWSGPVAFEICTVDSHVPQDVFSLAVTTAGRQIGIGRFRPENRGYYGRFASELIKWEQVQG